MAVFAATSVSAGSIVGIPAKVGSQVLRWKAANTIRIAVSTSLTQPNANIKFDSDDAGLFVSTPTCPTAVVGWFRPACASYACTTAMVELFCMIERPI